MCLEAIDSRYKTNKLKKSLPKWFPVWKIVRRDYRPEFGGKPFVRKKEYVAEKLSSNRSPITYEPGFHAILNAKKANEFSFGKHSSRIMGKFWARPEWITKSGVSSVGYRNARTVVLKKIRRK